MKQNESRPNVLYGLQAITAYMGRRDPRCVIRWRAKFGFPLFYNPSALLVGKYRFYTHTDAIKAWEYALANAVARNEGRVFDQRLSCPLCGRSGESAGGERGTHTRGVVGC